MIDSKLSLEDLHSRITFLTCCVYAMIFFWESWIMKAHVLINYPNTIFVSDCLPSTIIFMIESRYLCGIGVCEELEGRAKIYIANKIAFVVHIVLLP